MTTRVPRTRARGTFFWGSLISPAVRVTADHPSKAQSALIIANPKAGIKLEVQSLGHQGPRFETEPLPQNKAPAIRKRMAPTLAVVKKFMTQPEKVTFTQLIRVTTAMTAMAA